MGRYICAVDVGTRSARAGVFAVEGDMLSRAVAPIRAHEPEPGRMEHDSGDIWRAVALAVREARESAGLGPEEICALGFDATCSLVLRDGSGGPLGLSGPEWDTISWCDHRAGDEAAICAAARRGALDRTGGAMSPEMQLPKLMWLKRHAPDRWAALGAARDLADFLTWRATGAPARSLCTLATKWAFQPQEGGWRRDFLDGIGLRDLPERAGLPERATPVGAPVGRLSATAAAALGLAPGAVVAAGLIDAYAGAIGALGGVSTGSFERDLALISGTSACVMGFAPAPRRIEGAWGPVLGAALPGLWVSEGGLSAAGGLLDFALGAFGGADAASPEAHAKAARRIGELRAADAGFADGLHVLPDFHGNRSPFAEPDARGVVSGLTLDRSFDALCRLYWRCAVAIALGMRQIVEHLNAHGFSAERLHMAGGHAGSALMPRLYADATGCEIRVEPERDLVLLGSAAAAAAAAGWRDGVAGAAAAMSRPGALLRPDPAARAALERDYAIFLKMQAHRREIEGLGA